MAMYSFDLKTVSLGAGQSAVAAAAYIMRDRRTDERTGLTYDFSRHASDVLAHGTVGPVDWQAAQRAERRRDAVVARTIILPLPYELDLSANIRASENFLVGLREYHGLSGQWSIQAAPEKDGGDPRNLHAHIELSTRRVDDAGHYGEKTKELDNRRTGSIVIKRWRQQWQDILNLALAEGGRQERVDCRSLKERGIERPARKHLGPAATAQLRKGLLPAAAAHNLLVDEWEKTAAEEAQAHNDYEQLRHSIRDKLLLSLNERLRRQTTLIENLERQLVEQRLLTDSASVQASSLAAQLAAMQRSDGPLSKITDDLYLDLSTVRKVQRTRQTNRLDGVGKSVLVQGQTLLDNEPAGAETDFETLLARVQEAKGKKFRPEKVAQNS